MTVAETLSTGHNAERPGWNRGELKLNQSALGSAQNKRVTSLSLHGPSAESRGTVP